MTTPEQPWLVIVNPHAGSGKTIKEWNLAKWHLEGLGVPYVSRHTASEGHAIKLAYKAAEKGYRKFIAVGGDGTAHEVANGIAKFVDANSFASLEDFTLGVIPIGSGNDWIRSHNVPHDTIRVVDLMEENITTKQDIVRITNPTSPTRYMLNIGGIGLDPEVCDLVNRKKAMGQRSKFIYVFALLACLFKQKGCPVEVIADGEKVFEGNLFTMGLGIGKYCGGGMRQCPDAALDDGLLDYSIVNKDDLFYIFWRVWRVFTPTFQKVKKVTSGRAKTIEVRPVGANTSIVEADGEIVSKLPVKFEIMGPQINCLHVEK